RRREAVRERGTGIDRLTPIGGTEGLGCTSGVIAGGHGSIIAGVCAIVAARNVAPEYYSGVRPVERADVAALLELVDHPGRPGVADLEPPLQQRGRGTIVF